MYLFMLLITKYLKINESSVIEEIYWSISEQLFAQGLVEVFPRWK